MLAMFGNVKSVTQTHVVVLFVGKRQYQGPLLQFILYLRQINSTEKSQQRRPHSSKPPNQSLGRPGHEAIASSRPHSHSNVTRQHDTNYFGSKTSSRGLVLLVSLLMDGRCSEPGILSAVVEDEEGSGEACFDRVVGGMVCW